MSHSYVVTGGGRGIGRVITERLLGNEDVVVIIELDEATLDWTKRHPAGRRIIGVAGNASDEVVAEQAADLAQAAAPLAGWVNNAAIFRDASIHSASTREILDLIAMNFNPTVVGCAVAIRHFLAARTGGAIVNVSSHQARRAVPGALPYATAKAAIEGLTRALAVDYGPRGIRVNAVALGSITTERYETFISQQETTVAVQIQQQIRRLHPIGRIGQPEDVAGAVAYLLSNDASFITGVTLPVDGGRSILGLDPEAHDIDS